MTPIPYRISITVSARAPFIVQDSEPGAFGLDMVVARDADGIPIIPGTLLTGKLKDAWAQFGKTGLIECWLGKEGSGFQPSTGRLCEVDLCIESSIPEGNRTPYSRVKIDEDTGAGEAGALFFIEQPWAPGESVSFRGSWPVIGTEAEIKELCGAIQGGLMWMAQLGSQRSIGFGQMTEVKAEYQPAESASNSVLDEAASRLYFALSFTEPLCLPQTATDNLFVGSDIIAGNALKAAFALTWGAQEEKWNQPVDGKFSGQHKALAEAFSLIGFSHAFPAGDDENISDLRPLPLPQSLVLADDDKGKDHIYDAALLDQPHLIHHKAPAFQIDWKDKNYTEAGEQQFWGQTRLALRVRTAIEAGRRISEEDKLFAYETVSAKQHTRWLGWVDFSAITDSGKRKVAMESFIDLTQRGLHYVGKTKAVGALTVMQEKDQTPVWQSITKAEDGKWIVMLNTPALLTPISCFNETSGKQELHDAYAEYWEKVSGETLELSHYFARQRLAGGEYAHKRRQKGKPYKPWLLTEAGSVFVLKAKNETDAAAKKINGWLKSGLPLSDAVKAEYTDDWQHNPYLPQNGYGEISVNIAHPFTRLNAGSKELTHVQELTLEEEQTV